MRMDYEKFEELMYHASRGANDQLYDGLAKRFLLRFEEDIRSVHERLEKLELLIKMLIESKNEAKKEVNVEAWKPNLELQKVLEKVDKEKLAKAMDKAMEDVMKVNTLRTFSMPKVEVPEFKKGADEK
ncbi:hypothetical protein ABEV38_19340 [Parageobacillus thermoglucosidasius]|uniref:hypothetical protein n=1 Tax=Parageobacillus thermoglucosidasius TaxID=1426 RepID=UPI003D2A7899